MLFLNQSTLLQSLGWAILNSLWQLAFLWVIYQLVFSIYRTAGPDQRSRFASILLLTGFGWFLYTFFSHWFIGVSSDTFISKSYQEIKGYAALDQWLHLTLPAASVAYLFLLVLPLFRFIRNYRFVQQLRHTGLHKIHVDWRIFVKRVSAEMGIKKPVHIWISDLVSSPVTIGYIKPIILVPMAAINHLSAQQLEAVLLHELSHIRRFDYFINLIITFIQTILYFNPFVSLFVKVIEREREKSCDEAVMHYQYDPEGYATALLLLEKNNQPQHSQIALAASGKRYDLLARIETILGVQKNTGFSFNKIAGVFAGLLCIIALNALFIFSKPEKTDKGQFAFMQLTNPYYFFAGKNNISEEEALEPASPPQPAMIAASVMPPEKIISAPEITFPEPGRASYITIPPVLAQKKLVPVVYNKKQVTVYGTNTNTRNPEFYYNNAFIPVGLTTITIPELNSAEQQQVLEAVEASKIVLEKTQWKEIEKSIADVMTSTEKEKARLAYQQEVEKLNWKKLEERLKVSYNEMDWYKVNNKLNNAIISYQLDSIQQTLTSAMVTLSKIQAVVSANQSQELIHPEICLDSLRVKKLELEHRLEKVKALKAGKIIQL